MEEDKKLENPPKKQTQKNKEEKRKRIQRTIPTYTFSDSLILAEAIQKHASGQKVRRLTLFDHMGKSPESSASRQLIVSSNKYGLTQGAYNAEYLELTPDGAKLTDPLTSEKEKVRLRFKLAIESIPAFKKLYEQYINNRLPSENFMKDFLKENEINEDEIKTCIESFIINAKYVKILKSISGAERIIPIEQVIEELPAEPESEYKSQSTSDNSNDNKIISIPTKKEKITENWDQICFYITPIGDEGSENRKHSDLFLNSLVIPSLEEFNLKVIRADQIGKPGMISAQIIEHIIKSKLVIADLSFHNPNVFYELSLRHACKLPTVQIIRAADKIPFDLDQFRTIKIDTTDIYSLVPQLHTYRTEISSQVRKVIEDVDAVDNPISIFFPKLKVSFN